MTRACYPDATGYVENDGARVYYEIYGEGDTTVYLLPTWQICHRRHWKAQVPFLSRYYRVITSDHLGSGESERPEELKFYTWEREVSDAIAVMDATETEKAVAMGCSNGGNLALLLAAHHPERMLGIIPIGASAPVGPDHDHYPDLSRILDRHEGWDRWNEHYMREHYREFAEWFESEVFPEPHSTKQIEDMVDWSQETTPDILIRSLVARGDSGGDDETFRRIACPTLLVHGDQDRIVPVEKSRYLAELCGARLLVLPGSGHAPQGRIPAKMNLVFKAFIDEVTGKSSPAKRKTSNFARQRNNSHRAKRALYLSSPIGLGHARRDLAIARELRKHHPNLEIDWLAQHPVTAFLENAGEHIHPASHMLANESKHIEAESDGHDLHVFEAYRRMDEILVSNFMLFQDVVTENPYDVIIGDEAWDVDYFWHEHPELKKSDLIWFTDFVGFLPMPEKGERDVELTADYNLEMIRHVEGHPKLRDRAIFVGNPEDCVELSMGPGLPMIRNWTRKHFDFCGYVTGFDPKEFGERAQLRSELGFRDDERIIIATVGGSGVGLPLLKRIVESFPLANRALGNLRMIAVAGPRIDPTLLDAPAGVEVRAFVPDLPRHLAACDLAIVQGGLTTCMELTASGTPFIYVPLRNHFEQNFHVRHRLQRYEAGRYMDFGACEPDALAAAMVEEVSKPANYKRVETDGAARAAAMVAELL